MMGDPRTENQAKARSAHTLGANAVEARPRVVFVELTRACNLACQMCREPRTIPRSQRMPETLFTRVLDELGGTAELIDLRGWGESVVLSEFGDRVTRTSERGAAVRVVTNLSYRRDANLALLAEVGAYIGVSLDAADRTGLSLTRRGADLELIDRNLRFLGGAYGRRGIDDRLCLYVTIQRPALRHLADLVRLAADAAVHDVRFAPVTLPGDDPHGLRPTGPALAEALGQVEEEAARLGVAVSATAALDGPAPSSLRSDAPCSHPWWTAYVTYDGRVGFCDHLIGPDGDELTFGSLTEQSFEEIWNGAGWKELRAEHLGRRRPDLPSFAHCAWCYRHRFLDHEDLLEPELRSTRVSLRALRRAASAAGPTDAVR